MNEQISFCLLSADTVDIGYMVIGYMVKSDIWSILRWDRFPHTKIYLIYGQISDIWSEIQIKFKTRAVNVWLIKGIFSFHRPLQSSISSGESANPFIGVFKARFTSHFFYLISLDPSTVTSDIWSYCLYGQFLLVPTRTIYPISTVL